MKRKNKLIIIAASFLSVFVLGSLSNKANNATPLSADSDWAVNDTKALASNAHSVYNGTDAYIFFKLSSNDYASMTSEYLNVGGASYYQTSDYNFLTYIEVSNDNETYIPFGNICNHNNVNYFFKDGTFRFGLKRDTDTIRQVISYQYIRVLEGCEFPSYNYCVNGGTKTKFVQKETSISKLSNFNETNDYGFSTYSEYAEKKTMTFTGIAMGWNNSHYGNLSGYNQLILCFGEHNVDFLANDHKADATNRAKQNYDIGQKLTFNGLPIYKIYNYYSDTKVGYDHGFAYFYVQYPVEVLQMTKNNMVPTLHIEEGTEFMDVLLPEVTLKYMGGSWVISNASDYRIEEPLDIDFYRLKDVTFPHEFGANNAHPVLANLPSEGASLAFDINFGELSTTNWDQVVNFDGLYNFCISMYPALGRVALIDRDNDNKEVQVLEGLTFTPYANNTFEIDIQCGEQTTIKVAINHLIVIDYVTNKNKTASSTLWIIDTVGTTTMDYYKEVVEYVPIMNYGGSAYYDFVEGDPVYNFANVVNPFDLYSNSVGSANLEFEYEDGAVTDGKYNAGVWTLTIKLVVEGYKTTTKTIMINVHGKISIAKIYYDDAEDYVEAPIGSKLVAPPNPNTYREGEYDYVFDGWYFEGAKWDFENDVVAGDMHLYSRFKATVPHYIVSVSFEGVEIKDTTYSLTKGSVFPFELFDVEGATFEVYLNNSQITSLVVEDDISLVVKYTIVYTYIEAVAPTCLEDGNIGYWYSQVYSNYYFADSRGREVIKDVVLPKLNHDIIHLDYKDSTCSELGNVPCYYCNNCHKHFTDEEAQNELEDWFIAKKPHILTHHASKEATCEEDGNLEYWSCANEKGVYYGNEECSYKLEDIVIKAFGHDYRAPTYNWIENNGEYQCIASIICTHCQDEIVEIKNAEKVVVRTSTCSQEGQISYFVRFDDDRFNSQNKIVTTAKAPHTFVHVAQIDAVGDSSGVKEHYECSECHKYFLKYGDNYLEVLYNDLLFKNFSVGCGGDITTTSLLLSMTAGALSLLLMLRRKEER